MHIGLVIYGSLDATSGGYLYDRKLVGYLHEQGEQVEIISMPWRNYPRHLTDNISPTFRRRLQQFRGDILLQDELNHPSLFLLNRRLKTYHSKAQNEPSLKNIPFITIVHHLRASEHHSAWQLALYRQVEQRYLSSVDGFIFNSQTTSRTVRALAGNNLPSVIAYPAGDHLQASITQAEITQRACQEGPLRVIFVGNIIPRKGLHTLISSLSRLPPGVACLTVAGSPQPDPDYASHVQRLVAQSGLGKQVIFLGNQTDGELKALLRSHHIMGVPSSYEGFGIVYLEGMAFGLPAIGSTAGAAAEIITPNVDGFLVDPEDPAELSQILSTLHHDRRRLTKMSLAARKRFLAHPTWDQTCALAHNFIKNILTTSHEEPA